MRARTILSVLACAAGACADPGADLLDTRAPGSIHTIAGTGMAGFSGDGGAATRADLYLPIDVTPGPDAYLYVLDWNNHRIRRIDPHGDITTFAGSGYLGDVAPGPALESPFNHPTHILFDRAGDMIVAAWHNSRVVRIEMDTGDLELMFGTGRRKYSGDDGPVAEADFDVPVCLALGPDDGALYVADQFNQMIRRVDEGGRVTRFAGCACPADFSGDGGPALDARFAFPHGAAAMPGGRITFGLEGELYVADTHNGRIRRIDRRGTITTFASGLQQPTDVEVGPDGVVYVAEMLASCVRAIDRQGVIRTVAGQCGARGFSGDGGPASEALLDRPMGVAVDALGNLYIADSGNHRIRRVPSF